MSLLRRQQVTLIKYQSGQTMVFAMVFIVVILIGLITLFNTGQLTRHKMEVQNAADAAAYSAAVLTARELNYMAYSNRAMIANQITIGQLSAFDSWGKKYLLGSMKVPAVPFVKAYASAYGVLYGATAAISYWYGDVDNQIYNWLVWLPFTSFFKVLNTIQDKFIATPMAQFNKIAEPYIGALQSIYGIHQQGLRFFTFATQIETIPKIIDDNAKGARLSNFGALATLMSAAEHQFSFLKSSGGKKDGSGKRRFAGLINDNRGQWTRDRSRTDLGIDEQLPTIRIPFPPILEASIMSRFILGFADGIQGGTDLRFVENKGKQEYTWSSLDTVEAFVGFKINLEIKTCLPPPFEDQCITLKPPTIPVGVPLSFGGAASETGEGKLLGYTGIKDKTNPRTNPKAVADWSDDASYEGYGGAWVFGDGTPIAATEVFTNPFAVSRVVKIYKGDKKYPGLPVYVDIDAGNYDAVDAAPVFIISVRKDASDLRTSDQIEKNKKLMVGEFDLETKLAGGDNTDEGEPANIIGNVLKYLLEEQKKKVLDELFSSLGPAQGLVAPIVQPPIDKVEKQLKSQIDDMQTKLNNILTPLNWNDPKGAIFALAAGEVYFKNPDDSVEVEQVMGSTFSPYWQARLKQVDEKVRRWSVISQGIDVDWVREDDPNSYVLPLSIYGK